MTPTNPPSSLPQKQQFTKGAGPTSKPGQFGVKGIAGQDNKPSFFAPKVTPEINKTPTQNVFPGKPGGNPRSSPDAFGKIIGPDRETVSNFDFKRQLRRIYLKDATKWTAGRSGKMSKEDMENLKKLTVGDYRYGSDAKISKGELKKIINLKLSPAIKKGVDPDTKKRLDPYSRKDQLRMQDLKEYRDYLKRMVGGK
jgi:hypothetical protein